MLDIAVFRFTLGIPGFDDDLIPRFVGFLSAALLVGNHVLAGSSPSGAQVIRLSAEAAARPLHRLIASRRAVPACFATGHIGSNSTRENIARRRNASLAHK